ncbi:MAG TPA: DUF192 domain-containing protein [Candidatus Bathyarchaeia archaeon]|nr:DUF192 domain-containing protein [Candidatus Bathyarchaeia archaeon]
MPSKNKIFTRIKFLLWFLILIPLLILTRKNRSISQDLKPYLNINKQKIYVEIADDPLEITRGLSGKEALESNQGMLFVFQESRLTPFWMNKMKFNLDFVFINGREVVDLAENIPFPKTGEAPQVVISKKPFDRVLEINAGEIKKLDIKVGNQILFFP